MNSPADKQLSKNKTTFANKVLFCILAAILTLLAIHLFLQYLNLNVYHQQNGQIYELSNRFDFDDESSVPTWLSQFLFLCIGVAAAFAAYMANKKPLRRMWSLVAAISIIFSIDEVATLHERFLQMIHVIFYQDNAPGSSENAWLLIAPFILSAGIWILWNMIKLLPNRTVILFFFSGVLFLAGAIGIDMVTSFSYRDSFAVQGLMVALEEGLELISMSMALYAIVDYIESKYRTPVIKAKNKLKTELQT